MRFVVVGGRMRLVAGCRMRREDGAWEDRLEPRRCYDDDATVAMMVVLAAVGEEKGRVAESEYDEWIDRLMRNDFGFAGKSPSENFSGGGATVVAGSGGGGGWPDILGKREGPNGGSGGLIEGRFGERCGGNGGRGGSMSGVGEGKVNPMGGIGGGSLAIRSMVSNDGRGGFYVSKDCIKVSEEDVGDEWWNRTLEK
ncbi:hypothetical protein Tco_0908873 [Tanacetum coccineum]|uniref:Uncharacterized protein n=1 Tax=Tanacetum coccineum TaxID=301880 RepID=A0ABQ5CP16_9ASTR